MSWGKDVKNLSDNQIVYAGRQIIISEAVSETYQRRVHKKKRINKKWLKKYGVLRMPLSGFFVTDRTILIHPETWEKLKEYFDYFDDDSEGAKRIRTDAKNLET